MKEIKLTKGYVALVDDEDFERVNVYKWYAQCTHRGTRHEKIVAERKTYDRNKIGKLAARSIRLARFIMGIEDTDVLVTFRDANSLNLQKINLELKGKAEVGRGTEKTIKVKASVFKGVTWSKAAGKWQAGISIKRKRKHLGVFDSEKEAAIAYDMAAIKYFGAYASLNILEKPEPEGTKRS